MEIKIERFKSLQSLSLDLDGITLLVGGNNAGKSSALQAIQFGVSVAQTTAMVSGKWAGDRLPTSIGQSDLVYSPIKDVMSLALNGRLRESGNDVIKLTYIDGSDQCVVTVKKGRNKNISLELSGRNLGEKLQSVSEPYSALVTGLAGIQSEEEFETNLVIRKSAAKGNSNSIFRNILFQLKKDTLKWTRFKQQIRNIFPIYNIDVKFDPDVNESIDCLVIKDGVSLPIDSIGTGVLQAIQIFSYINLFEPKILLLDEPDSHLHPNNQKALVKELIRASEQGLKIVISSHSKHIVEALIDNAKLIWLRGGEIVTHTDDYELKALMDIGALNVGDRITNPKYVFLTEDKTKDAFKILLVAAGYDLNSCQIESYAGCTQVGSANILINQLKKTMPNAKYTIHRDRDFIEQDALDKYAERFAPAGIKTFIPVGNDIESYFISSEHISAVCDITLELAQEVVSEAFEARKSQLVEKYVNTRIENIKKSGSQVNAGSISAEAMAMTDSTSPMVHGKTLLKGIRDSLQSRGISIDLVTASVVLDVENLRDLWPET